MFRLFQSALFAVVLLTSTPAVSADVLLDFAPNDTCPDAKTDYGSEYKPEWTPCERWVWSCIRDGLEANLHIKQCVKGRRDGDEPNYRSSYLYAAFYDPDRLARANALSDGFVRAIASDPALESKIPPLGIRIFGAYFATSVNLENVTTTKNLVLDGSIFKRGVRMTNFQTTKNVSFDHSNVRGAMLLMRARIDGSLFLERGVFDFIDARDIRIGSSLEASRSVFNDMLRFDRGQIAGKVYLVKSRLTSLNAWDAKVGGSMELRLADIRMRVDLSGSAINGDLRLQQVSFGRQSASTPVCQWDATGEINHVLHEAYDIALKKDAASAERVLDEVMRSRPTEAGKPAPSLCDKPAGTEKRIGRHEVLLKNMEIEGTLCVMDTSGAIGRATTATAPPEPGPALDTISLDGTRATSTVLRWVKSDSTTLWRAVNFRTGHMLINLRAPPNRHFIDDLDIGFLSIVKRDNEIKEEILDEDDDKYLCDVTPKQDNIDAAESQETQNRIVNFFTTARNESGSSQPFAKVVERIESTGVNTIYLKKALSQYRLRTLCRSSLIANTWIQKRRADPKRPKWELVKATYSDTLGREKPRMTAFEVVDETRKLTLDGLCTMSLPIARYSVSYGHEPHNLFLWALFFVLFFWLLLKFDKRRPTAVSAPRLGLIYAIDTFIPMSQLRMNRRYASVLPERTVLRWYLSFHRLVGLVTCLAIFILVVNAAR